MPKKLIFSLEENSISLKYFELWWLFSTKKLSMWSDMRWCPSQTATFLWNKWTLFFFFSENLLKSRYFETISMYNIIKRTTEKRKPSPPRQQAAPSGGADKEETDQTEEETTKFEGLPVCPVSGDSSKGCKKIACLHRDKVKHPYYLINKPNPSPVVTKEIPERPKPEMVHEKVSKPEKPIPKYPPPLFPLPPRRNPLEEQQRRARLNECRQRLTKIWCAANVRKKFRFSIKSPLRYFIIC